MALNIIQVPSPNHFNGRAGYTPRFLILHGTAGGNSAQAIANYFADPASQVSSHYIVDQAGNVIQCVAESDAAWGNGVLSAGHDPWWSDSVNPNYLTISIEHAKASTDNSDALTAAQKAMSFLLILDICKRNAIPMRKADANGGITGHYSIDPVNRSRCPGPYPMDELIAFLSHNGGTMGVPTGWSDDGATLTASPAPDGKKYTVAQGFRDYILAHSWDPNNVPVEAAHGIPGQPGTQQCFRFTGLAWTPDRGVYVAPVGSWLVAARAQITALQAQPSQIAAVTSDLQSIATAAQDALSKLKS